MGWRDRRRVQEGVTMDFHIIEKLGPKQSLTPEGFLLCEEVPIARTGMLIYGPDETPIKAGPEGLVKIHREPEEVFRPESIASAQGKSVTDDHPDEDVNPENWKELTVGTAFNVRRGLGAQDDLLLADFLITDKDGIEAIRSGRKTEVSCGYEADYEEISVGVGRQKNIIINHIALVENGRCGPRCAVGDRNSTKEVNMAVKKGNRILDALMKAFKAKDAEEVEQLAQDLETVGGEEGDTHIHIHNGNTDEPVASPATDEEERLRFTDDMIQEHIDRNDAEHAEMRAEIEALREMVEQLSGQGESTDEEPDELTEQALKDEAPEGMEEQAAKAKDSAYLSDSFQDTASLAEILVPGVKLPVFDGAAKPTQSLKKLCHFRKSVLDLAYNQPATRGILDELMDGKSLETKSMTCDAVRTLFRSAAAMKKAMNNSSGRTGDHRSAQVKAPVVSLAELNRRNNEHWKLN